MLNYELLENLSKHYEYLKKRINSNDFFLVGGSIRDLLLGINKKPHDIDITLAGNPQDIYNQIDKNNISIFKTEKFGTITILPKQDDQIALMGAGNTSKVQYEITPLRTEGKYDDFRHPGEINWTENIVLDSHRRDFTINCLYYSVVKIAHTKFSIQNEIKDEDSYIKLLNENGMACLLDKKTIIISDEKLICKIFDNGKFDTKMLNWYLESFGYCIFGENKQTNKVKEELNDQTRNIIIDIHGGVKDLIDKSIKCVGNPDDRFGEDALRVVRGARFLILLNEKLKIVGNLESYFDFDTNTRRSMKKNYLLVKYVAKERLRDEYLKIFKSGNPFGFVSLLDELKLLQILFPSIGNLKHNDQPVRYHPFDTYTHTLLTLYYLQGINTSYLLKFGALYHDVGKPDQYYYISIGLDENERKKVYGGKNHHTNIGEEITQEELRKNGFSNKEIQEICFYVKYHMLPGDILSAKSENIEKKIKKLLSEYNLEWIINLIDLAIADRLGQFNPIGFGPEIQELYYLKEITQTIFDKQGQFKLSNLEINGNDIMEIFSIKPGPQIREILNQLFERVLEDVQGRNNKQIIIEYIKNNSII
ncbi:MAG: HD domain-containing protein [Candidatus Absconditabacteria bacterium]